MSVVEALHLQSLERMKHKAENVAERAKDLADSLRSDYAAQLLADAFPDHTHVTFSRHWDDDFPTIDTIRDEAGMAEPIHLRQADAPDYDRLSATQRHAVAHGELQIISIGSDDDILKHLQPGEVHSNERTVFVLALTTPAKA